MVLDGGVPRTSSAPFLNKEPPGNICSFVSLWLVVFLILGIALVKFGLKNTGCVSQELMILDGGEESFKLLIGFR